MTRILMLEDDPFWADLTRESLTGMGVEFCCVAGEQALLRQPDKFEADLYILDLLIAGSRFGGRDVVTALRTARIDAPILILTSDASSGSISELLDLGADDYLAKPFDRTELAARVRALMRRAGKRVEGPLVFDRLTVDARTRRAFWDQRQIDANGKVFETLLVLAQHQGDIVTRDMLWARVWGPRRPYRQDSVIDATISRLRGALRDAGAGPFIQTLPGQGFRFDQPLPDRRSA